ncbi:MAG: hypothetical protein KDC44_09225 [Phaeodactylibacter sp.]|nr:hypothetical protein [Phaeodactylibacter sp.]
MSYPNSLNLLRLKALICIAFISMPLYSSAQADRVYAEQKYLEEIELVELDESDQQRINKKVVEIYHRRYPYERDPYLEAKEKSKPPKEMVPCSWPYATEIFGDLGEKFKQKEQCYAIMKNATLYTDIIVYYQRFAEYEDHHDHLLKYLATKHFENKEREVYIKRVNCVAMPIMYGTRKVYKGTETERTTEQRVLHKVEITTTTDIYEEQPDYSKPLFQGCWVILYVRDSAMYTGDIKNTWTISPAAALKAYEKAREIHNYIQLEGGSMRVKKLEKRLGPEAFNYTRNPEE